jgi:hypothetical protein
MSKRRARHHVSRRRAYSVRRRELRERRQRTDDWERYAPDETAAAIEIEGELDFEAPASWVLCLPDRANAA